eukprot:TRINITY_DN48107_c0_g1_i2.p1 TRINITY_DN48107_c0_g1~~TRINITY_DN48107_c0_g1_i2.p1  ORF type:complete len:1040 (-),score=267.65 TRINITY_DN48107_c0_g1_i2:98-3217(-)
MPAAYGASPSGTWMSDDYLDSMTVAPGTWTVPGEAPLTGVAGHAGAASQPTPDLRKRLEQLRTRLHKQMGPVDPYAATPEPVGSPSAVSRGGGAGQQQQQSPPGLDPAAPRHQKHEQLPSPHVPVAQAQAQPQAPTMIAMRPAPGQEQRPPPRAGELAKRSDELRARLQQSALFRRSDHAREGGDLSPPPGDLRARGDSPIRQTVVLRPRSSEGGTAGSSPEAAQAPATQVPASSSSAVPREANASAKTSTKSGSSRPLTLQQLSAMARTGRDDSDGSVDEEFMAAPVGLPDGVLGEALESGALSGSASDEEEEEEEGLDKQASEQRSVGGGGSTAPAGAAGEEEEDTSSDSDSEDDAEESARPRPDESEANAPSETGDGDGAASTAAALANAFAAADETEREEEAAMEATGAEEGSVAVAPFPAEDPEALAEAEDALPDFSSDEEEQLQSALQANFAAPLPDDLTNHPDLAALARLEGQSSPPAFPSPAADSEEDALPPAAAAAPPTSDGVAAAPAVAPAPAPAAAGVAAPAKAAAVASAVPASASKVGVSQVGVSAAGAIASSPRPAAAKSSMPAAAKTPPPTPQPKPIVGISANGNKTWTAPRAVKASSAATRPAAPSAKKAKADGSSGLMRGWLALMERTRRHPQFAGEYTKRFQLEGKTWRRAKPGTKARLVLGLDCEMVYAKEDPNALARVSVVSIGAVLLDVFIRRPLPDDVLDYRTAISGVSESHLREDNGAVPFEEAQDKVLNLLSPDTILVGHALQNDLRALRIMHGKIVDTALLFTVEGKSQWRKHKLHSLVSIMKPKVATLQSADPDASHDSVQDAEWALQLALYEASIHPRQTPPLQLESHPTKVFLSEIPKGTKPEELQAIFGSGTVAEVFYQLQAEPRQSEDTTLGWMGTTTVTYPTQAARDAALQALPRFVQVHAGPFKDWAGRRDIVAMQSELMKHFSKFGRGVRGCRVFRPQRSAEQGPTYPVSQIDCHPATARALLMVSEAHYFAKHRSQFNIQLAQDNPAGRKRVVVPTHSGSFVAKIQ